MIFQKIQEATDYIKERITTKPKIGIILGSGLGVYVDQIENKTVIPYNEIPHFHQTTVEGHEGRLILGQVKGVEVAVYQGRFHVYEGHDLEDVVLPVRVLSLLGAEYLLLTNAAGGINSQYVPGDLVCISDHINMTGRNPLVGKNIEELGPRFPDMTAAYDLEVQDLLVKSASENGFELYRGVYAAMLGPTYETPAEIKMLDVIGADMVGMSTVPEAIAANHLGLRVGGVSCITNLAAGISKEKLHHDEVKEVAKMAMMKFSNLLTTTVEKIGSLDS
jgi:purine-nucleoside phosphorylase